ncbi:hypothetical protein NFHSH190041_24780 [Shewanella sp. NFH-SH190041]|uniref:DUF6236 family protein n=1 Tax=Shewanella sp. NFH-SH190041 TaxID=2950245 RepID=UPI0021C2C865|nr:DUF6236 family protein [Shewanella sp. NFH-SH190041]BDM65026.1 hypothetical protein NFHSH190041_24780 [Shewanella sp. NFH-SH190041]
MDKGIIVSPIEILASDGFSFRTGISLESFNQYLLYWNHIVIPTNNIVHVGVPHEDLLVEQKIISRPKFSLRSIGGKEGSKPLIDCQMLLAKYYMDMEPGKWVLAQSGTHSYFTEDLAQSRNHIQMELANILPVPPSGTNLEDILQFKLERKDELDALWYYLDKVCLDVQKEPDRALAQRLALHDFGKVVEDSMRVTSERWRCLQLSDVKVQVSLDWKTVVGAFTAPYALDSIPNVFACAFGVAASSLKVNWEKGLVPTAPDEQRKLSYLTSVKKNLILAA